MKNISPYLIFLLVSLLTGLLSCTEEAEPELPTDDETNILLIIADDLGKDAISGYQEGSVKASTPNIDAIREGGLAFNNFWVNPTCTPTRAAIITGKYGLRTGVKGVGDILNSSELTLQQYIRDNTNDQYATAVVGKWHLSGNNTTVNPESFGIDYYAGLIRGAVDDYYQWQLREGGTNSLQTNYTTEVFTDLAIDWINEQSKPWFLWLAYNAPHTPFHVPPSEMHQQGTLAAYTPGQNPEPYYMAAIEAMDFQIGRLLDNIPEEERERTIIVFIGDNGSPGQVAQSPYTSASAKSTLYQGGINVPLFISGAGVTRLGTDDHLITGTDLFSTISEIAGISNSSYHDSQSFKSLLSEDSNSSRLYSYSELGNDDTDCWAIRNVKYKLIICADGNEEMYDLENDPYEQNNLRDGTLNPAEADSKSELENELARIRN